MKNKLLYVAATCILISGCSGTLYTKRINALSIEEEIEGIIFYGVKMEQRPVVNDRIRNPKTGEITHSMYENEASGRYCSPQTILKDVAVADYTAPYQLRYKPAWFEAGKFSVTLSEGKLATVNTESTPGLVTALQGINTLREDILDGITAATGFVNPSDPGNAPRSLPCTTNV